MNNKEKALLAPKLRFPKFRGARGWTASQLIDLTDVGLSNGVFNDPKKVGTGYKLINVGDMYIDTTIVEERLSLLTLSVSDFEANQVKHGDIFFTRSSLVKSGIAVSNIYLGNSSDVTFDGHLIRFRANSSKVAPLFAHYLFKTTPVREQLVARGKSGTMTTIGQSDVGGVMLSYPEMNEQRRVADCLSALDELIAAQARKVDVLKAHKKGLMQQLFPREGETQPRLRFPEFKNSGDWVPVCVAQFAKVTTGAKDTQNKVEGGRYPFFVRSQTVERINSFSFDGEAVLTSGDGVGVGKNFHYIKGKFDFHQRVYCIFDFAQDVSGLFFYLYFSEHFGERVMRMSAKNSVDSVRRAMITEMPVMLPKLPEQQRIGDCLTALDDLISAATQEFETHKIHKKGLMQQLFPSMTETV